MRALLAATLALVLGLCGSAAEADQSPEQPRAALERFACQHSANALDRAVAVTALMRPVTGTAHLELRFNLQRKSTAHGSFTNVSGGDLGKWRSPSDPTLGQRADDVWIVDKQVANLAAPAVYRFRVAFRWLGADGRPLSRELLASPRCVQS